MKDKETKGEEEEEEKVILRSIDQRQPLKDEPECVVCFV
jgi:hypothetical protein